MNEWQGRNCEWSKIIYNWTLPESWDRTDFTSLQLSLGTETRASLTFLGGRVQGSSWRRPGEASEVYKSWNILVFLQVEDT